MKTIKSAPNYQINENGEIFNIIEYILESVETIGDECNQVE